ncbi:MAG: hypothetical protein HYT94_00800 [Parcubacteria group bacterium]|nr:hypothetical protein [Parcubacteria group bacterium]
MLKYILPIIFFVFASPAYAYEIQGVNAEIRNDFVLSPAKIDVSVDPGGTATEYLTVTNRQEKEMSFKIEIEDFKGSQDPTRAVFLLGPEKGPYSLKDFLSPEVSIFTLKPKQMITFPVMVSVPSDASPGGLYGSVLISSVPVTGGGGGAVAVSRLGALFFVRVNGDTLESGELSSFKLKGPKKLLYQKGPFSFEILYKNSGTVHLVPYGVVRISNIFGQMVDEFPVDPYFAMPDSVRYREIAWNKNMLVGRYKAQLLLNRGYENIIDTAEVSFIVLPTKIIVGSFVAVVVLLLIFRFLVNRFEIRVKRKP